MSVIQVSGRAAPSMLAPPPTNSRGSLVREKQRHRRLELRDEVGEVGKLGMMRGVAVDEYARDAADSACHSVSMRRWNSASGMRSGCQSAGPISKVGCTVSTADQPSTIASAAFCAVSGSAPCAVITTGSPHSR